MHRPGDLIAKRFEVLELLAIGGMGAVHRARDHVTRRDVALKIIHSHLMVDPDLEVRFFREARIAAEIGHPGLVEVLQAGIDELGTLYLTMPFLSGENLRTRVRRPLTTRGQALAWIDAMLDPLAAAHEKGFVHRDLKPENVFVAEDADGQESIRLLDFGIAKHLGQPSLTATGAALGTPRYMAPEQVTAREVGPAADVWSVGVMLYELVAGAPPFSGPTPQAAYVRACTAPHVSLGEADGVGPHLSALIDRALHKDPAERPADARSLRAALRAAMLAEPEGASRPITMHSSPPPANVLAQDRGASRPSGAVRPSTMPGVHRAGRIVFGMVPQRDDEKTRLLLSDLCGHLTEHAGIQVLPHRAPSAEALASALRAGRVQVAWTGALLLLLSEHMAEMVPILSAVREGVAYYHSVVFSTLDSAVQDLAGARGKRIAWVAPSSASGYVVPRLSLVRAGLDVNGFFSHELFAGSHANAARSLWSHQVDVASSYAIFEDGDPRKRIVKSGFLTFDPRKEVRILDVSGPIPGDLIVATPAVSPEVRRAISAALLHVSTDEASRGIMTDLIGAESFTPFSPAVLREVRALVAVARTAGALPFV